VSTANSKTRDTKQHCAEAEAAVAEGRGGGARRRAKKQQQEKEKEKEKADNQKERGRSLLSALCSPSTARPQAQLHAPEDP